MRQKIAFSKKPAWLLLLKGSERFTGQPEHSSPCRCSSISNVPAVQQDTAVLKVSLPQGMLVTCWLAAGQYETCKRHQRPTRTSPKALDHLIAWCRLISRPSYSAILTEMNWTCATQGSLPGARCYDSRLAAMPRKLRLAHVQFVWNNTYPF